MRRQFSVPSAGVPIGTGHERRVFALMMGTAKPGSEALFSLSAILPNPSIDLGKKGLSTMDLGKGTFIFP